jgi:RNA polymerase sigma factor (sigma-70 family)
LWGQVAFDCNRAVRTLQPAPVTMSSEGQGRWGRMLRGTEMHGVPSDAEVLDAVRAGDMDAFDLLYRRFAGVVTAAVTQTLGPRDGTADVVQDVFCRVLERLADLRQPDRFVPWLLAIARHAAIDHARAGVRTQPDDGTALTVADDRPGPEELVELAQLADLVRGRVAGLSARDALAVTLVVDCGFSPAEVAVALGIETGTARVLLHRARRRLRDALADGPHQALDALSVPMAVGVAG